MTVGSVIVKTGYTGSDADGSTCSVLVEYSFDGSNPIATCTPDASHVDHDGISGLVFAVGGTAYTFVWDAEVDLGSTFSGDVFMHITPTDGTDAGVIIASPQITLTTVDTLLVSDDGLARGLQVVSTSSIGGGSYEGDVSTIFTLLTDINNVRSILENTNLRGAFGVTVPALQTRIEL